MERMVQLQTSDNVTFEVELRVLQKSQLVMETIEATGEYTIPLPFVPSNILSKVIEYCTYHMQPKQSTDNENQAIIQHGMKEFDAAFAQVDFPTLVGLIHAANYMNMRPLLDLMCQRVADMITSKSNEEIRRTFAIKDVTPDEEQAGRRRGRKPKKPAAFPGPERTSSPYI